MKIDRCEIDSPYAPIYSVTHAMFQMVYTSKLMTNRVKFK